ncbi:unnamed protein product [Ambrosiozyma monospora]|uniref:Unnamed protein product n=1 Tax=Ambrosiozyma monospora TaxID=43982 RepID=A0ACB5TMN4_AMBMO|nr:unnamed protein product [Ambrosiozyma monospora]
MVEVINSTTFPTYKEKTESLETQEKYELISNSLIQSWDELTSSFESENDVVDYLKKFLEFKNKYLTGNPQKPDESFQTALTRCVEQWKQTQKEQEQAKKLIPAPPKADAMYKRDQLIDHRKKTSRLEWLNAKPEVHEEYLAFANEISRNWSAFVESVPNANYRRAWMWKFMTFKKEYLNRNPRVSKNGVLESYESVAERCVDALKKQSKS